MTVLTLGPVVFDSFEVPNQIAFGGRQRLVVHALPGGARVVDALGADDAPIAWSGVFTGSQAPTRARLLDRLRIDGAPLPLAWEDFRYTVVIAGFQARFERATWIPYRIACLVLTDRPPSLLPGVSLLGQMTADLALAAGCPGLDLSGVGTALAVSNATSLGTNAYGQASAAMGLAAGQVESLLSSGATALDAATDVPGVASAAGQLAQVAQARGYVLRAQSNLASAGS